MTVESATYGEDGTVLAVIDGQQYSIPDDLPNRFRRKVAEWEAAGNTISPYVAPPAPTDEERINAAFQTDVGRVIFEEFFEVANRLQALERKNPVTRAQLRDRLKSKLTG